MGSVGRLRPDDSLESARCRLGSRRPTVGRLRPDDSVDSARRRLGAGAIGLLWRSGCCGVPTTAGRPLSGDSVGLRRFSSWASAARACRPPLLRRLRSFVVAGTQSGGGQFGCWGLSTAVDAPLLCEASSVPTSL